MTTRTEQSLSLVFFLFFVSLAANCATTPEAPAADVGAGSESALVASDVPDSNLLPVRGLPMIGRPDALVTVVAPISATSESFDEELELLRSIADSEQRDVRVAFAPGGTDVASVQAWKLLAFADSIGAIEEGFEFLTENLELWRTGDPIALAISSERWSMDEVSAYLRSPAFESASDSAEVSNARLRGGGLVVNGRWTDAASLEERLRTELVRAQALLAAEVPREEVYDRLLLGPGSGAGLAELKDSEIIPIRGSAATGSPDATVTIVGFMDLQCPFTKRSWKTVEALLEKNPDTVRFVFKHQPLAFHKEAKDAAIAAEAARQQGKFFEFVDRVFERQKRLKSEKEVVLEEIALEIGLEMTAWNAARRDLEIEKRVEEDQELAKEVSVRGVPHFRINGLVVVGAQPEKRLQDEIDAEDAAVKKMLGEDLERGEIYAVRVEKNYDKAKNDPTRARKKPDVPEPKWVPVEPADPATRPDAPVTIVVFSDFECPFCQRAVTTLDKVEKAYGKDVRIVFKHFPLPFHKNAEAMAYAAIAAQNQGKFWEMHDLLFANQRAIKKDPDAELEKLARTLKLDMKKFNADRTSDAVRKKVERDVALAQKVGARGTPNFFVNGVKLVGAKPMNDFSEVIDEQMSLAKGIGSSGEDRYKKLYEKNVEIYEKK